MFANVGLPGIRTSHYGGHAWFGVFGLFRKRYGQELEVLQFVGENSELLARARAGILQGKHGSTRAHITDSTDQMNDSVAVCRCRSELF